MKILMLVMFNPFTTASGTEIFAGNLARALMQYRCDIHIVCSNNESRTSQVLEQITLTRFIGYDFPLLGAVNDYSERLRIVRKLLKNEKFDAVLAVGAGQGSIFTSIARSKFRPPLLYFTFDCMRREGNAVMKVLSLKGASISRKIRTMLRYLKLSLSDRLSCAYSDLVMASSADTKQSLNEYYGVELGKVQVTYAGIPESYSRGFDPVMPLEPTFLHVATDHERKGTIYLLMALNLLKKEYNLDVKVSIVGEKDPTYIEMAKRFGVNASFIDLRLVEHREIYASCTALIVPSVSEGFCLPVIEAAMFGKPAIVTSAGSLPELVTDEVDGYVVPVADATSLAQKIYVLATDQEILKQMSAKAKEKALRFEINNTARATLRSIQMIGSLRKKEAIR